MASIWSVGFGTREEDASYGLFAANDKIIDSCAMIWMFIVVVEEYRWADALHVDSMYSIHCILITDRNDKEEELGYQRSLLALSATYGCEQPHRWRIHVQNCYSVPGTRKGRVRSVGRLGCYFLGFFRG